MNFAKIGTFFSLDYGSQTVPSVRNFTSRCLRTSPFGAIFTWFFLTNSTISRLFCQFFLGFPEKFFDFLLFFMDFQLYLRCYCEKNVGNRLEFVNSYFCVFSFEFSGFLWIFRNFRQFSAISLTFQSKISFGVPEVSI